MDFVALLVTGRTSVARPSRPCSISIRYVANTSSILMCLRSARRFRCHSQATHTAPCTNHTVTHSNTQSNTQPQPQPHTHTHTHTHARAHNHMMSSLCPIHDSCLHVLWLLTPQHLENWHHFSTTHHSNRFPVRTDSRNLLQLGCLNRRCLFAVSPVCNGDKWVVCKSTLSKTCGSDRRHSARRNRGTNELGTASCSHFQVGTNVSK